MHTSKVWYITGASHGRGLSLVKQLLDAGHRVAATTRNVRALKEGVGLIDKTRFLPLVVDLNNTDCIDESIHQTLAAFGRIDVVVNNAAYSITGVLEEMESKTIRDLIDINLIAAIEVTKQVLPVLKAQGSGHIINVGPIAALAGTPGGMVYAATKAALAAFSDGLALELAGSGIRVNVADAADLWPSAKAFDNEQQGHNE